MISWHWVRSSSYQLLLDCAHQYELTVRAVSAASHQRPAKMYPAWMARQLADNLETSFHEARKWGAQWQRLHTCHRHPRGEGDHQPRSCGSQIRAQWCLCQRHGRSRLSLGIPLRHQTAWGAPRRSPSARPGQRAQQTTVPLHQRPPGPALACLPRRSCYRALPA